MPTKLAPQPKLTVVNKVLNIPSILLGLTQWIHTREATVLRHAITARAKVICTSRISSIYNTHGRTGSDWGRTGVGLGVGLGGRTGVGLEEADRGSDWGSNWGSDGEVGLGVGLGGRTRGSDLGGSDWGGSDWGSDRGGWTREVGLGSDEVAGKISQVSL